MTAVDVRQSHPVRDTFPQQRLDAAHLDWKILTLTPSPACWLHEQRLSGLQPILFDV